MIRHIAFATVAVLATACAHLSPGPAATAELQPTRGNSVTGLVRFTTIGTKVRVEAEVRGLKPGAEHGFHIHEKGDCSSGDGMSAGGHFNPGGKPHGAHTDTERHAGDLLSLKSDAAGVARLSFETDALSVGSGSANVVGRGLIVHRDPDDFKTQPTGNSGPRLACAIIAGV